MKMRGEVVAVSQGGEQRWGGAALYKVTVASTAENDCRVSEIHVDARTARRLTIGRRVEVVLRPL
jgi:hypothetical protein